MRAEANALSLSRALTIRDTRYTTANPENLEQDFEGTDFKAPMAGFGMCCCCSLQACTFLSDKRRVFLTTQATVCRSRAFTRSILVETSS